MCDFKPGDLVEAVRDLSPPDGVAEASEYPDPPIGWRGRVLGVVEHPFIRGVFGLMLEGWPLPHMIFHDARRFRKVQPRDLAVWLKTADGREPAPRCPKVLAVLRGVAG